MCDGLGQLLEDLPVPAVSIFCNLSMAAASIAESSRQNRLWGAASGVNEVLDAVGRRRGPCEGLGNYWELL
jgi:hypothetical protein